MIMYVEINKYPISDKLQNSWVVLKSPYGDKSVKKYIDTYRTSKFPIEKFIKYPVDSFKITCYDLFCKKTYYLEYFLKSSTPEFPKVMEISERDFDKYVHDKEELDILYFINDKLGYYPEDEFELIFDNYPKDEIFDNVILEKSKLETLYKYVSNKEWFKSEILDGFEEGKELVIIDYIQD